MALDLPAGQVIPDGYTFEGTGQCRGCRTGIVWTRTPKGARAPLDPDGTNHFVTCPERDRFRRRR